MIVDDLFEMMLYRGDSQHIEMFDINATDKGALFGPGLYLTSDPGVAHDYTAARNDERVYPAHRDDPECTDVKSLLRNYVMAKASEFNETKFKDEWVRKNGHGAKYNGLQSHIHRQMEYDMDAAKRALTQDRLKGAYEEVRQELPNLRVQKQTTGTLVLVKKNRGATVSAFNVPDEYANRTLNADLPLSDKDLAIVKGLWLATFPNDNGDMRDHRENFMSFDKWVASYKKFGTRYAWRDDDEPKIGGKGHNPSLDDIRNGTHGGYHAFVDSMFDQGMPKSQSAMNAFMAAGYVGIEYFGGARVGQHVRGGGGRAHRAFCFWDIPTVMKFRVEHHPLPKLQGLNVRSLPTEYRTKALDSQGHEYSTGVVNVK